MASVPHPNVRALRPRRRMPLPSAALRTVLMAAALLAVLAVPPASFAAPVLAETGIPVDLRPSTTTVAPGDVLVLEVHLSAPPDLSAIGSVVIQLDEARFGAPSVARGPTVPDGLAASVAAGRLTISFADPSPGKTQPIPEGSDVLLCTVSLPVLDAAKPGASSLALVIASGFAAADGTETNPYPGASPTVTVQFPPTATPEPTATPTPGDATPTADPEATGTPTAAPGDGTPTVAPTGGIPGSAGLPDWLLPAFLVALAVALLEFFLLLARPSRGRNRSGRR